MQDQDQPLARIAAALERLSPPPGEAAAWGDAPAFVWDGAARRVATIEAPALGLLRGIDRQKAAVVGNVARLARGHAAHDMLLWGARGMGKSALIRASVAQAQRDEGAGGGADLALVQVATSALDTLASLFRQLAAAPRNFLVYIDDLGFAEGDTAAPRLLRSWLDGGVEARPGNVWLAVTSNRRAILPRHGAEQDDPLNPRDAIDDTLALADRFGLALGFHACTQDEYLDIVRGYAGEYALALDEGEALEWAKRRGARSGRVAWHYIVELAGRAGLAL